MPSFGLPERLRIALEQDRNRQRLADWMRFLLTAYPDDVSPASRILQIHVRDLAAPIGPALAWRLLRDGLGLAFIRFNVARQEWHYHDILSDLIPRLAIDHIKSVLSVPATEGSVGGAVSTVRKRLERTDATQQSGALADRVVVLANCFSDPRGRVATEDQILGNRSWLAVPIFDEGGHKDLPETIGAVFLFHPVEGLFGKHPPDYREVGEWFARRIGIQRHAILLALENEALVSLLGRQQDDLLPIAGGNGQRRHQAETSHALYTASSAARRLLRTNRAANVADATGYLAAVEIDKSDVYVAAVGRPFASRLLQMARVAVLFPTRLGLGAADTMSYLARGERSPWSNSKLLPRWQHQNGSEDSPDLAQQYPSGVENDVQPVPLSDVKADRRRFLEQAGLDAADDQCRAPISKEVDKALELFSGDGRTIDLVVPLAQRHAKTTQGFVRINCLSDGDPASQQSLWSLISASQCFGDIVDLAGELFRDLAQKVESSDTFEGIKRARDLWATVAQVLADGIADSFTTAGEAPVGKVTLPRLAVARSTARDLGLSRAAQTTLPQLGTLLGAFAIEARTSLHALPKVSLVSVWTTAPRPILRPFGEATVIEELVAADPGLSEALTLLGFLLRVDPSIDIASDPDGMYQCKSRIGGLEDIIIPPVPDPAEPRFVTLTLKGDDTPDPRIGAVYAEGASGDDTTRADIYVQEYPEPIAFALASDGMVLGGLASSDHPGTDVLAELRDVIAANGAAPLTLKEFRAACPRAVESRVFRGLCLLGDVFTAHAAPAFPLVRLRALPYPLKIMGHDPTGAGGEESSPSILVALSLGREGLLLRQLRESRLDDARRDRLAFARAELLARTTLLRKTAAKINHDVAQPLAAVSSSYHRKIGSRSDEFPPDLVKSVRSTSVCLELLRGILDNVRYAADPESHERPEPKLSLPSLTDPVCELREILGVIEPAGFMLSGFAMRGVVVDVVSEPVGTDELYVFGNPGQWARALYHLLRNACQAALAAADGRSPEPIQVTLVPNYGFIPTDISRRARITITNKSVGLDPERLAQMGQALRGEALRMPINEAKDGSMGLGLVTAGQALKTVSADGAIVFEPAGNVVTVVLTARMPLVGDEGMCPSGRR